VDAAEPAYLPATEARRRFAAGELSPLDVLEAQIARTAAVEPRVNAFSATCFEEAGQAAAAAAARYVAGTARPLEGLTVAVKETMDVAGQVTTYGSRVHADDPPAYASPGRSTSATASSPPKSSRRASAAGAARARFGRGRP
jgi:Asp-tRNA(Asn)/Glu-tRNA(Gln) amidotransferase A subunit family amidase